MADFTQKSLIIFDWDGTLMDSIGLIVQAMHVASQPYGLSVSDTRVKSIIGLSLIKGIEQLFPDTPQHHQAILDNYAQYYVAHHHELQFFDGISELLQTLRSQGKLLAIATGKKRIGLNKMLDLTQTHDWFVTSRCADESGSKPDPQMLIDILAETDKRVEDAVFIGDSIHDIAMANAIKMDSIAVSYGCETAEILAKENPSALVKSVKELAALLV